MVVSEATQITDERSTEQSEMSLVTTVKYADVRFRTVQLNTNLTCCSTVSRLRSGLELPTTLKRLTFNAAPNLKIGPDKVKGSCHSGSTFVLSGALHISYTSISEYESRGKNNEPESWSSPCLILLLGG